MDYNLYHGIILYAGIFGYNYCKCCYTSYSREYGAILEDVAWVSTGYAVANVIILPMSDGWEAALGVRIIFCFLLFYLQ